MFVVATNVSYFLGGEALQGHFPSSYMSTHLGNTSAYATLEAANASLAMARAKGFDVSPFTARPATLSERAAFRLRALDRANSKCELSRAMIEAGKNLRARFERVAARAIPG